MSDMEITIGDYFVHCIGKSKSHKLGIWVIKRYKRVFELEPIIKKRKLSNLEIKKVYNNL